MYIRPSIANIAIKALNESLSVDVMVRVVHLVIPDYDLYLRTGYPANIPIPSRDAATQIVRDLVDSVLFIPFVERLIMITQGGMMGRVYQVAYLRDIVKELTKEDFVYNSEENLLVEAPGPQATPNWRRMSEGLEYPVALLCFDVAGNTALVRDKGVAKAKAAYGEMFRIAQAAAEKGNGRVWHFEGDGGLIAFHYGKRELDAVLAGIEFLHGLFLFNRMESKLGENLAVRLAVHSGSLRYASSAEAREKTECMRRVKDLEANHTEPDSLTVSDAAAQSLDRALAARFRTYKHGTQTLWRYSLRWEGF